MGGKVVANGTRMLDGRKVRNYVCRPLAQLPNGKDVHYFGVVVEDNRPVARWQSVPVCPLHPDSKVVRDGVYGKGKHSRQHYRCITGYDTSGPTKKRISHTFSPGLPREHVNKEDGPCPHCDELRGVHRGETAIARRHRFPTRIVVKSLHDLSSGQAFGKVSVQALKDAGLVTGMPRRREREPDPPDSYFSVDRPPTTLAIEPPDLVASWHALPAEDDEPVGTWMDTVDDAALITDGPPWEALGEPAAAVPPLKREIQRSRQRRNAWRIAAGWTEAFAPVIWGPKEAELRKAALDERVRLDGLLAQGLPIDRPQVLLIDDKPILAKSEKTARRDGGFVLLIAAEVRWVIGHDGRTARDPRLRLIRAMPKSNTAAWRLLFDELGYAPDFLVADAGKGLLGAYRAHFDPKKTRLVPSLWHTKRSIRRALKIETNPKEAVEQHLRELGRGGWAFESEASLVRWWDELYPIAHTLHLSLKKLDAQRANYEEPLIAVLPQLLAHPLVPTATGGLETIQREEIDPVLTMRATQFGNIERTNHLFDLVVARAHGAFDDHAAVARLLRRDVEEHGGWTIALRAYDDPQPEQGRYSSLRDATLLASHAADRGVA